MGFSTSMNIENDDDFEFHNDLLDHVLSDDVETELDEEHNRVDIEDLNDDELQRLAEVVEYPALDRLQFVDKLDLVGFSIDKPPSDYRDGDDIDVIMFGNPGVGRFRGRVISYTDEWFPGRTYQVKVTTIVSGAGQLTEYILINVQMHANTPSKYYIDAAIARHSEVLGMYKTSPWFPVKEMHIWGHGPPVVVVEMPVVAEEKPTEKPSVRFAVEEYENQTSHPRTHPPPKKDTDDSEIERMILMNSRTVPTPGPGQYQNWSRYTGSSS